MQAQAASQKFTEAGALTHKERTGLLHVPRVFVSLCHTTNSQPPAERLAAGVRPTPACRGRSGRRSLERRVKLSIGALVAAIIALCARARVRKLRDARLLEHVSPP